MDLAPFKLDIDELLDDDVKENCTSFNDFKRVWMAKKFSYIYEGSGKVGRIKISGGTMSAPQVLKELEWLIPGDHQWEILPAGENAFRVVFPTKEELKRLKRIKFIEVEGTEVSMHFEEWSSKEFDKWGLYDIWIRVSGCPGSPALLRQSLPGSLAQHRVQLFSSRSS